jgi:flagellar FliJ protein
MSKKTYLLLIRMIQHQRDEAANLLKASQKKVAEAEAGLEQLKIFRIEYQESFTNALQNGLDIASMKNYQLFIKNLDQSIEQQHVYIKTCEEQFARDKKVWEAAQIKLRTYEKLVEREKEREAMRLMRRERKMEDEFHTSRQAQTRKEDEHESND